MLMESSAAEKWKALCEPADVVLLSPPFVFPPLASVALSIFQKKLRNEGISSKVIYPMFLFAHLLGLEEVSLILEMRRNMIYQEYLFAGLTGVENHYEPEEAVRGLQTCSEDKVETYIEIIRKGCAAAEEVTKASAERIIGMNPGVLACSMIYTQVNAGLAICKQVKERNPDIKTLIGGSVSGETGIRILKDYPYVDYVSFGEGDETIAETCEILLGRKSGPLPYGVVSRDDIDRLDEIPHPLTRNMNTIPMPDYSDFLEEVQREENGFYGENFYETGKGAGFTGNHTMYLEGSRGCWWGQRHPCSFCGLNGLKNVFRQKDPQRIYQEIHDLTEQYPGCTIQLTDNILHQEFINGVLPRMIADDQDYNVFAEVKSNLTDEMIRSLCQAGIRELQPGIESLNDHLLELMGKGNTAVNHIALLKQCRKIGANPHWNMLFGIPGETKEDYQELISLIPKLVHLRAPDGCGGIMFQRFSRYTMHPEEYGLKLIPWKGMEYAFGDDPDRIRDMTFNYDFVDCAFATVFEENKTLYRELMAACEKWQHLSSSKDYPKLICRYGKNIVMITDKRGLAAAEAQVLSGIHNDLYRLMETPVSETKLHSELADRYEPLMIDEALKELEDLSLAVHLSGKWLGLAIPL